MLEIIENQSLEIKNLFCFRGKVKQTDVNSIVKDMNEKLAQVGAKRMGNPVNATFGVEGDCIDIEIMLPIDKSIGDCDTYYYKEKIKIVNAIVAFYKGNPNCLQSACNELNKYIIERKLQPITVGYNVIKTMEISKIDDAEIEVYVGINPNIL